MRKLLELLKSLKAQGYATSDEKKEVAKLYKALDEDEKEVLKEDVDTAAAMPEEAPADPAPEGNDDEEIEKGIKSIVSTTIKNGLKDVKSELRDEVQKYLEETAEAREKKAGIYNPNVQEKRAKINTYIRNFSTALIDNDFAKVKELSTDASGSPFGGYVVDSELSAEIRHLTTEYGVARREMSTLQLSKNSYKANELTTDVTVYWVDEGAAIKSTQPVLAQSTLELKKLGAIVSMTRELLQDEEIDLFAFVGTRVAEGFAQAEDEMAFIGDGTSTYGSFTGILEDSGVLDVALATGDDAFTDMDADDLLDMIVKAPQSVRKTGKFYMHFSILAIVMKLKDTAGNYIYQAPSQAGPGTVWGRPVVEVEVMPAITDTAASTAFVLYGDLKKSSIFGYRGGVAMDRFNAGVVRNVADDADINLITTDREAIRWVERVGVMHILPGACVTLTTGATS